MAINQANKEKWNDTVEKLREQLNLSDEELTTLKEWGVALLVTGVSVWILYRIVRNIFGPSKKTVKIKLSNPRLKETTSPMILLQRLNRRERRGPRKKSILYFFSLVSSYQKLRWPFASALGQATDKSLPASQWYHSMTSSVYQTCSHTGKQGARRWQCSLTRIRWRIWRPVDGWCT